ncbi:LysR family transcriptional regulator [Streptacidiphilus cavernicola]|uniref:LysR family transcriptional regulator n=1 Tax=Streptacidiphilus cavernicola TaxID=3342716 RepID=A0ABV6W529_9ACTN
MNELETRQLRYFVAVAEELHFGRAAERLGMAQPPLSRAIRDLEHQLGVALFERTTRQVALTPAGKALLSDARTVLDSISAAGRRAQHAGEPEPRLRLALKADIDGGLLPQILDAYAQDEAALPVELVLGPFGDQARALYDGRADAALLLDPVDRHGLDYEPLLTEPFLIALSATDPLAARISLCLADLTGRSLPDGSRAEQGPAHRANPSQGPAPTTVTVQDASDLPQILRLVELSRVICFLPASVTRRYARPEIAYLPVDDLAPATLAVAWPQTSRSPAVAALVRAAATVSAASPPQTTDITGSTYLTPGVRGGPGSLAGRGHGIAP